MKKTVEKVVAKLAYATAEKEANQGCPWLFYQPRLPEKVQKLNKFK